MADGPLSDEGENKIRAEVHNVELGTQLLLSEHLKRIASPLATETAEIANLHINAQQRRSPGDSVSLCENQQAQRRVRLVEAYFDQYRSEGHYNEFRLRHSITKDPDHPDDLLHHVSVLFLLLAIETVLNSMFWTQSLDGWISAALLISAGLSFANIVIGFGTGFAFAHKNLSDTKHQILGWGGLIAGIALACWLNFYIISLRTAPIVGVETTESRMQDIMSVVMFAVGMSFAVVAIFKGYRFLGSVPGYKDASTQFLEARKRAADLVVELKDSVHKEKREQEDVRRSLMRKVHDAQGRLARLKGDVQNIRSQYVLAMDKLHTVLDQCVKGYRGAYRSVKPVNSTTPTWFDEAVERSALQVERLRETEEQLAAQSGQLDQLAQSVRDDFSREVSALEQMATQFLGERLTLFTVEADKEALQKYEDSVKSGNRTRVTPGVI
jgi:hypothetical protein